MATPKYATWLSISNSVSTVYATEASKMLQTWILKVLDVPSQPCIVFDRSGRKITQLLLQEKNEEVITSIISFAGCWLNEVISKASQPTMESFPLISGSTCHYGCAFAHGFRTEHEPD